MNFMALLLVLLSSVFVLFGIFWDRRNGKWDKVIIRKYCPLLCGIIALAMTITPFYLFYSILLPAYVSEWCLIAFFLPPLL